MERPARGREPFTARALGVAYGDDLVAGLTPISRDVLLAATRALLGDDAHLAGDVFTPVIPSGFHHVPVALALPATGTVDLVAHEDADGFADVLRRRRLSQRLPVSAVLLWAVEPSAPVLFVDPAECCGVHVRLLLDSWRDANSVESVLPTLAHDSPPSRNTMRSCCLNNINTRYRRVSKAQGTPSELRSR